MVLHYMNHTVAINALKLTSQRDGAAGWKDGVMTNERKQIRENKYKMEKSSLQT